MGPVPPSDEFLFIGRIGAPFGVRGQVKLQAITDRPDHLERNIGTIYLGNARKPYRLVDSFQHKPGLLILTLEGITSREDAETVRHAEVFIREDESAPLEEGEYFIHQLYGLRIETTEGVELGRVREVLETGANEVLVVTRPGQSDVLIPMIHDVVQELDFVGGRLVIRLIEGLIDP